MKYESTTMRDKAVKEAYAKILREHNINDAYIKRKTILDIMEDMPAPRFYISPRKAAAYVMQYYRGALQVKSPRMLDMVEDLVENYERIKVRRPHTQQFFIWKAVVESPAKKFYCTRQTLTNIIFNYGFYGTKHTTTEPGSH